MSYPLSGEDARGRYGSEGYVDAKTILIVDDDLMNVTHWDGTSLLSTVQHSYQYIDKLQSVVYTAGVPY